MLRTSTLVVVGSYLDDVVLVIGTAAAKLYTDNRISASPDIDI